MRKDLRIGLGIGALILVFVVTFLIVRNHTESQARLQQGGDGASDAGVEGGTPEANPSPVVTPGDPTPATASNTPVTLPPLKPVTSYDPSTLTQVLPPTQKDPFAPRPIPAGGSGMSASSNSNTTQDWDLILATGRMGGTGTTPAVAAPRSTASRGSAPVAVTPTRLSTPRSGETLASPRPIVGGGSISTVTGKPYTIKQGDTFTSIAKSVYGGSRFYLQIAKANPSVDPSRLKIGQQIILPELPSELRSAKAAPSGPFSDSDNRPINPKSEYRVETGDSLYRIAMHIYGTPKMVDAIYEANKAAIGSDRSKLKFGMILKLPMK